MHARHREEHTDISCMPLSSSSQHDEQSHHHHYGPRDGAPNWKHSLRLAAAAAHFRLTPLSLATVHTVHSYTLMHCSCTPPSRTFCKPGPSSRWLAEHRRASIAHHHRLAMAEDCCNVEAALALFVPFVFINSQANIQEESHTHHQYIHIRIARQYIHSLHTLSLSLSLSLNFFFSHTSHSHRLRRRSLSLSLSLVHLLSP